MIQFEIDKSTGVSEIESINKISALDDIQLCEEFISIIIEKGLDKTILCINKYQEVISQLYYAKERINYLEKEIGKYQSSSNATLKMNFFVRH